jgi:hypothetical protein
VKGALLRAIRATRARCGACTSTSSPTTSLPAAPHEGEGERAPQLYERIFLGYGDDSVAQLGGAHVACEWVSNILTKVLQRAAAGAYLEQSTRYIAYDRRCRAAATATGADPELGPEYERAMDSLFDTYARSAAARRGMGGDRFPRDDARARVGIPALDQGEGARPAARRSCPPRRCRTWASSPRGQAYEQLILPPDGVAAARGARLRLDDPAELKHGDPSFVHASSGPTAAASGSRTCASAARRPSAGRARFGLDRGRARASSAPSVRLLDVRRRRGRPACGAALRGTSASEEEIRARPRAAADEREQLLAELVGERATAATARGAGSRRSATASRSSPTTARSATSSATGC